MDLKEYILKKYSINLTPEEILRLEEYLAKVSDRLESEEKLKNEIEKYISVNHKGYRMKLSADNSDLRQALKLITKMADTSKKDSKIKEVIGK